MKSYSPEWSLRAGLTIMLSLSFVAVGCSNDAGSTDDGPPRSTPTDDDETDSRPEATDPMPGVGMMKLDAGKGRDDNAEDDKEVTTRDASRAPAVVDAGKAKADAGGDAGVGTSDSAGDAGTAGGPPGSADGTDATSVCKGGKVGMDSESSTRSDLSNSRNFALLIYYAAKPNRITDFKTTLVVPKAPKERSTLFIWPGLQPRGGADPARLGNGVLQPVLTWGPSCSRTGSSSNYSNWMIAGMYVNISTSAAGPSGCASGDGMAAAVGEHLDIDMALDGTSWTQTISSRETGKKVDFKFDLKGQDQNWAIWDIETPASARPAEDTVFESSVLTFASPVTSCQPTIGAKGDTFTAPVLSPDGLHCCYDKVVLKQQRSK